MIVDVAKSIHPFFKKSYPTLLLSSLDTTSEKEERQASLKWRREEDDD